MALTNPGNPGGADLDLTNGDFGITGYGDLAMVGGLNLVEQRIYLKCKPEAGGVLLHPEAGAGVGSAVDQPFTSENAAGIASAVQQQAQSDPAVQQVLDVEVTSPQTAVIDIDPLVTLVGGSTAQLNLPLVTGTRHS